MRQARQVLPVRATRAPSGPAAWGTNWITGGQLPPAGTQNASSLFYQSGGYPRSPANYLETDDPDGYPPSDGVSSKNYLVGGVTELSQSSDEAIQGLPYSAPQVFYAANSGGFTGSANGQNTVVQTPMDRSLAVHCYQTEIQKSVYSDTAKQTTPTTPGHIISYLDGVEYLDTLHNWNGGAELVNYPAASLGDYNPASSIMVALQYGPTFDPNASAAMTPAVVNADHMLVRSIRVWTRTGGAHVAPTLANGITPPAAPPVQASTASQPTTKTASGGTINGVAFNWFNQGTETLASSGTALTLSQPAISGDAIGGISTGMAAGDGSWTFRYTYNEPNLNYYSVGVALYAAGTSQLVTIQTKSQNSIELSSYSNQATCNNELINRSPLNGPTVYVRVVRSGTNYTISSSSSGSNGSFVVLGSEPASAIGSPDTIGVYVDADDNTGSGSAASLMLTGYIQTTATDMQLAHGQ